MKKTFVFAVGLLAMFMFLGVVSAALTVTNPSIILNQGNGSFNIFVKNNGTQTVNASLSLNQISDSYGDITFTPSSNSIQIANGTTGNFSVTYDTSNYNFQLTKEPSTTFNITDGNSTATGKINFKDNYCYSTPNLENGISVSIDNVKTLSGYGSENEWYVGNNMEIKFDVSNSANYDLRNAKLEWVIYTTSGKRIDHGTSDSFSLNSGDDKTVREDITLDSHTQDLLGSNLIIYAKVSGKAYNSGSNREYNGNLTCESMKDSNDYSVASYGNNGGMVIPTDLSVNGIPLNNTNAAIYNQNVSCESSVTLSGNLYNIGDSDESNPYLVISSPDLNVSKLITFNTINSLDTSSFTYTFNIPSEMKQKLYQVALKVYDDNNDIYQGIDGNDVAKYVYLNVYGNCVFYAPTVSANLEGTARAGRDATINFTVTNNQDKQMTYALSLENYNSWATLSSINPSYLVIPAHSTQTAKINLKLNDNSEGQHNFNIITSTGDRKLLTQPVSITVDKKGFKLSDYLKKNTLELIGFILLDLIILLAIIIVAYRLLRRKK